jgi:lysylphosphatidylglycerol synthetase-like protein (DUF2156 family)
LVLTSRLVLDGILAVAIACGIIVGARKFCDLIGAPLWFAKFLFICASLVATYFISEASIPEYNKPWGVWIAMFCASFGIITVSFILFQQIEEEKTIEKQD